MIFMVLKKLCRPTLSQACYTSPFGRQSIGLKLMLSLLDFTILIYERYDPLWNGTIFIISRILSTTRSP